MFGRDSGDAYVLCPFDNTHQILAKSFNSHLVRCRKNFQHLKKVPCKFDRTHMILKPELAHHHSVCPSRAYLDRDMQIRAGRANGLMGNVSGPEIRSSYVESTEEDWDSGPSYTKTNALFSRMSSEYDEEDEMEEDYTIRHPQALYDASAAAAPSSSISSKEESFRRVPLAPSKAAQLSAPLGAKPKGSSSMVYEYSLQQAVLGRGRGRGLPSQSAPGLNTVRPLAANQRPASGPSIPNVPAPHLGRGIARFATPNVTAASGRGFVPISMSAPLPQGLHTPDVPEQPQAQFEDSEDVQAQSGGTSAEIPVSVASEAEGDQQSISLEEKVKMLLGQEQLEREELKRQQDLRHQQLMQQFEEEKSLQAEQLKQQQQRRLQQQLQQLTTYANRASVSGPQSAIGVPPQQPSSPSRQGMARGRGRSVDQQLRSPQKPSIAQRLQAEISELKSAEVVPEAVEEAPSREKTEADTGVKGHQKQNFSKMSKEELTKVNRKLEKKLKQISALEKKALAGTVLSSEEEAKLKKKSSILREQGSVAEYL